MVTIAKPFAVGKFEVTFAEWDACVVEGGCKHKPADESWGRGERPVINISWTDITEDYLPWLSKKTGKPYRLLSEAEWEYAARGGPSAPFGGCLRYWWGDEASHEHANFGGEDGRHLRKGLDQWDYTAPVGQFPPNPFGLHDMHGNVFEWVQDCSGGVPGNTYDGAPIDGSANISWGCGARVTRGGSCGDSAHVLRSARRIFTLPSIRANIIGFRIARTVSPP